MPDIVVLRFYNIVPDISTYILFDVVPDIYFISIFLKDSPWILPLFPRAALKYVWLSGVLTRRMMTKPTHPRNNLPGIRLTLLQKRHHRLPLRNLQPRQRLEPRMPKGTFYFSLRICMGNEVLTPLCVPLFEAGPHRVRHRYIHDVKINHVVPDVGIRYPNIRTSGPI